MTARTIRSVLGPGAWALQADHRGILSMPWPQAPQAAGPILAQGDVKVDIGERFAVVMGVAVVPIRGILTPDSEVLERWCGWTTYAGLDAVAGELAGRADVAAVALDINSPGGLVLGLDGAYQALKALAGVKPVHAIAAPMAASAAYHLACAAGDIAIAPGGIVGSIGVMRDAYAYVQPNEEGEQWSTHLSSHARAKDPDPTTEVGRGLIQTELDALEARFHAAVAEGRGMSVEELIFAASVTGDAADGGAVFWGEDAVTRRLADTVESRDAFYARMFEAYAPKQPPAPRQVGRAQLAAPGFAAAKLAMARAKARI